MVRTFTESEYAEAWADEEVQAILKSVLLKFQGRLAEDEIESCAMVALWKVLRRFDPNHRSGKKFSAALWQWTLRDCLNVLEKTKRRKRRAERACEREEERFQRSCESSPDVCGPLATLLESVPEGYRDILTEHFLRGKPVQTIAAEQGRSPDSVRDHIDEALRVCRFACDSGLAPIPEEFLATS